MSPSLPPFSAFLDAVDLAAAALTEYERRRAAWQKSHDEAANHIERARCRSAANADLLLWQDIVHYFTPGYHPADSRPMAASARKTLDKMRESGRATNAQIIDLYALTRHLEMHSLLRHGGLELPSQSKAA